MAKKAKKALKKAERISLGPIIKAIESVEKQIKRAQKKAPQEVVAELQVTAGKLQEAAGLIRPQCNQRKPTLTIFPL